MVKLEGLSEITKSERKVQCDIVLISYKTNSFISENKQTKHSKLHFKFKICYMIWPEGDFQKGIFQIHVLMWKA